MKNFLKPLFEGTHYGVAVTVCYAESLESLLDSASKCNVSLELSPIICTDNCFYSLDVFKFKADGSTWYCIFNANDGYCYITSTMPDDIDLSALVSDLNEQYKHKHAPRQIPSKFNSLFKHYYFKACEVITTDSIPEHDLQFLPMYEKKAEELGLLEERDEWYEGKPYDEAKSLMVWKIMADLMEKDGYEYQYMELIGKLDHHDIDTYESDIERLKNGYFWRSYINFR